MPEKKEPDDTPMLPPGESPAAAWHVGWVEHLTASR